MTISKADLERLEATSLDDLYAELAIAEAGTEDEVGSALGTVSSLRVAVATPESADSLGWLIRRGKKIFNRHWGSIKDAVCQFYKDEGEKWIEKAAEAIAKLLSLPGALVALILKIAIKLGMDMLCGTDAPAQPA